MEKHRNTSLTTDEFIGKARVVHRDRYDYSEVSYKNRQTPISIICPVHGLFLQRPSDHTRGKGCSKCANNLSLTTDEFIHRAHKIHGYKYDYRKVVYNSSYKKVILICPFHGELWQSPH